MKKTTVIILLLIIYLTGFSQERNQGIDLYTSARNSGCFMHDFLGVNKNEIVEYNNECFIEKNSDSILSVACYDWWYSYIFDTSSICTAIMYEISKQDLYNFLEEIKSREFYETSDFIYTNKIRNLKISPPSKPRQDKITIYVTNLY